MTINTIKNKLSYFVGILSKEEGYELLNSFKEGRALSRKRAKRIDILISAE